MIATENTYQSILQKLSRVSVASLPQVDLFLQQFIEAQEENKTNREEIMSLAGSWDEMSEMDFQEYLDETKRVGNEAFSREITL